MISVVVLCAGSSTRMGQEKNKVLLPLDDKPMFMHSVEKFLEFSDDVVVVTNANDYDEIIKSYSNVVLGGATRQESVYCGIKHTKYNKILIHDGARPFVASEDICKMVEVSNHSSLAFLGNYLVDSIKDSNYNNLNRDGIILTYTPQLVLKEDYFKAYEIASRNASVYTDDVSLVSETLDIKPLLVIGQRNNTKITTKEDYEDALFRASKFRIGHSWDIHALVSGRKLILGGVEIPFEKGLLGHSDADALLHAISESILGALALGDLGKHFPDNDPKYKGIDSRCILASCYEMMREKGYVINNLDTMIYAEKPKMANYIPLMKETISKILEIKLDQISIKATTHEKMGVIGNGEAIACESFVLLKKN
mgnify:CR=1 FL=1